MKRNKIYFIVYLLIITLLFMIILFFSFIGGIERNGYISDFTLDQKPYDDKYIYHFKLRYYDKIFRSSDLFGVYIVRTDFPHYIEKINLDGKGSPFGRLISIRKLSKEGKINDVKYVLKIRPRIYFYFLLIILTYPLYAFFRECIFLLKNKNVKNFLFNGNLKKYRKRILNICFCIFLLYSIFILIFSFLAFRSYNGKLSDFRLISKSNLGYIYKSKIMSDGFFGPNFLYKLSGVPIEFEKPDYIKLGYHTIITNIPDWPDTRTGKNYKNDDGSFTASNSTSWNTYNFSMMPSVGEKYKITIEAKRINGEGGSLEVFIYDIGGIITNSYDMSGEYEDYTKIISPQYTYDKEIYPTFYFPSGEVNVKYIKIEQIIDKLFPKDNYAVFTSSRELMNFLDDINISYRLELKTTYLLLAFILLILVALNFSYDNSLFIDIFYRILSICLLPFISFFIYSNIKNADWTFLIFGDVNAMKTQGIHGNQIISIIIFYLIATILFCFFIYLLLDKKKLINIELNNRNKLILFLSSALVVSASQVLLLNSNYPRVGHDFSLFIARAMSSFLFGEKNGLAIEWASPLFGGGLLIYAHPSGYQYTPVYFLTFLMPLWVSYNVVTFLFALIGFVSTYFLLKDIFNFDFLISLTGAVFFTCTGYYIIHLRVGHLMFVFHPLTAFVVWVFFSDRFGYLLKVLLGALSVSMMLYGGGSYTIFFYTCFVLLGIAAITFESNMIFLKRCFSIIGAVLLGLILSISKMLPTFILASKIDRGPYALSNVTIWSILKKIYFAFFVSPLSFFEHIFFFKTKEFGSISLYSNLWENDIALPFLLVPLLIIILIKYRRSITKNIPLFIKKHKWQFIFFILWIYLYFDMLHDKGITHSLLPSLNKINLHLRLSSVLIIPTIIIFCYFMSKYPISKKNKFLFILLINISTVLFFVYYQSFIYDRDKVRYSNVNISTSNKIWEKIKENKDIYYVNNILPLPETVLIKDFLNSDGSLASSQYPYEPIYGYKHETFTAKEKGSPFKIVDGRYNFTHPNSLIFYSSEYPQFSGFSLDQLEDLDNFLNFNKVDWKLPKMFHIANIITLYGNIFVILLIVLILASKIYKKIKGILIENRKTNNLY